jgi:hypothetical protein
MPSIFDSIQQEVTKTAVQRVSTRLGVDPVVAQQVVTAAIPLITAAMAAHASSGGAGTLHREATAQAANPQNQTSLPQVVGDQHSNMVQRVSDVTGISRDDADKLVGAVAPAVLRGIGQHVQQQGLDSGQLANVLSNVASGSGQARTPGSSSEATL